MYYERVSFLDKLINTITSPFNKNIVLDDRSDTYQQILGGGNDIGKLSKKWIKYYYLTIHTQLFKILSTVYDSYTNEHENTFIPVNTRLDDLYIDLHKMWKKFDSYPFIQELKLGQYDGFKSLNDESEYRKKLWKACKQTLFEDIDNMPDLPTYQLTNDLKLAFKEIDELLEVHKILINKTLFGDTITYKKLTLNKITDTFSVNNGKPINITSKALMFLKLMVENIGKPVTYKQIAETLDLQCFLNEVDSAVRLEIQQQKKEISENLVAKRIDKKTADEIRNYIEPITKKGYIIRNPNKS